MVDGGADEFARLGFAGWGDAVFEVVGDAVGGQGPGFVEELLGGARDCVIELLVSDSHRELGVNFEELVLWGSSVW